MVNIKHQEMKIMKKIYLIAAAAIVSSAVACNKAEVGETGKKDEGREVSAETPIKVNIRVSDLSSDTKAVKSGWEDGDVIHLWLDNSVFDNYFNKFNRFSGNDFPLKYDKSKDEWTFQGDLNEDLLKESGGFIRGFYESSNQLWTETDMAKQPEDNNVHENRALWGNLNVYNRFSHPYVWYDGPGGTGSRGRLGILTAVCNNIPYTYNKDTKVLTAKIDKWRFPTDFQLVVTGLDYERGKYTLYSDQIYSVQTIDVQHGEYPYDCWIADYEHDESEGPLLKAGSKDGNIAAVENPDGIAFVGKLRYPGEAKKYTFTLVEVAYTVAANGARVPDNYKVYTLTIPQEMTLDSQNGSKLVAAKVSKDKFRGAVNLGLPSGTKWATSNVGAETPESWGGFFAWGETWTKGGQYKKENYSFNKADPNGTRIYDFSKYCDDPDTGTKQDNKYVLDPEDDAATVLYGPIGGPRQRQIGVSWCNTATGPGLQLVGKPDTKLHARGLLTYIYSFLLPIGPFLVIHMQPICLQH